MFTLSGGIDLRYYKGEHYREVYDLLGGDYAVDEGNNLLQESQIKRVGDRVGYHNDGVVKWSGLFSQLEYSDDKLSAFLNISGSNSAYKRIDYFKKNSKQQRVSLQTCSSSGSGSNCDGNSNWSVIVASRLSSSSGSSSSSSNSSSNSW